MLHVSFPALLLRCLHVIEKYVFNDWNFVGYFMVVFLADTVLGIALSFRRQQHHSRNFRQVFTKLIQYVLALISVHVLIEFQVDGQPNVFTQLAAKVFKGGMYLAVLWAEVKSIDENLRLLGLRGLPFPPFMRRWFADFEKSGAFVASTDPADPAGLPGAVPAPLATAEAVSTTT